MEDGLPEERQGQAREMEVEKDAPSLVTEIFGEEAKDDLPEEFNTMTAEDVGRRWA